MHVVTVVYHGRAGSRGKSSYDDEMNDQQQQLCLLEGISAKEVSHLLGTTTVVIVRGRNRRIVKLNCQRQQSVIVWRVHEQEEGGVACVAPGAGVVGVAVC